MSAEALYQAVRSGRVRLEDLNDEGKSALRDYMQTKDTQPSQDIPTPAISTIPAEEQEHTEDPRMALVNNPPDVYQASMGDSERAYLQQVADNTPAPEYKPPLSNVNPAFAAKLPGLNKALETATSPIRRVMSSPWAERAGQTGSEVMTMTDRPDKVSTGSTVGDVSADLLGFIMGAVENPLSAGSKALKGADILASRYLPTLGKPAANLALRGAAQSVPYDIGYGALNNGISARDVGVNAAASAGLNLLPYGVGRALANKKDSRLIPNIGGLERKLEGAAEKIDPGMVQQDLEQPRLPKKYGLAETEKTAMARLTEGIQEAQNYVKHNDILAAYPPGTTVEQALADIKVKTGVDLPKLVADVESVQAKGGLRQQVAEEAKFSRLGMAAGVIPEPAKLVGLGRERVLGSRSLSPELKANPLPEGVGAANKGLPLGVGAQRRIPEKMEVLPNNQRVRSLGVSAAKAEGTAPEVQRGLINEMVPGGRGAYDVHSNERTLEWADRIVNTDTRQAERYVRENAGTDLSNTVALKLIQKANAEKRFDDATDLIQLVSQKATTQGQAIQSLRMWGNMTTEGMQKFYVKTVENINRDLEKSIGKKAQKLQVKPETMAEIKANMEKIGSMADGRDKDIAIAQTLDLIAAQVPVPFLRKVASIQTMAQLLNPKTAIRNIVGNLGFAGLENVSGAVGAAIDKPLSLLTGQRTKVLPSLGAQAKGFKQGWKHGLEDALLGIDTSGMATKFDLPRGRVFRSGPLGFAEKALNIELRATDRAFYQAAYEDSLLNQMRAAKTNAPTEEMRNIAHLDGLYRTFQDDNGLSKLFVGIKQALNKVTGSKEFGAGDFIVKYPRTPANLLMRGLDYSPAGFVKTILEAAKPLAKRQFNQKAFVESFSRALVGSTALFGAGALLHKLGVITGRPAEDRDLAELNRQQGFGEYRLNASALKRLVFGGGDTKPQKGDTIVSYDWFQPQAIPLAIGADIDANKGGAAGLAGTLLQAFFTGVNAFAEQPVMQGIQTLFGGGYGNAEQGLIKVLEGVPASFIPTLLSQVKQLADNQRRETYDPNKRQEALNRAANKIPGLAGKLPVKHGTLGQPLETYQGGSNNPFNVFLNPAFVNTYNPSKEVQRVNELYEQTGETKQVPRVMDKSIIVSGQKFVLSGKEYAEYQRLAGEYTQQEFAKMSGNLKAEDAVKKMQDIMTDANTKAKTEILKARGVRVYKKGSGIAVK